MGYVFTVLMLLTVPLTVVHAIPSCNPGQYITPTGCSSCQQGTFNADALWPTALTSCNYNDVCKSERWAVHSFLNGMPVFQCVSQSYKKYYIYYSRNNFWAECADSIDHPYCVSSISNEKTINGLLAGTGCSYEVAQCTNCPAGKYGPSTGMSACTDCEIGSYSIASGQTACTRYDSLAQYAMSPFCVFQNNTYIANGKTYTVSNYCWNGFYSYDTVGKIRLVDNCAEGTMCNAWANVNIYENNYLACTSCVCNRPNYQLVNQTCAMIQCGIGYYKANLLDMCKPCKPGTFASRSGMTSCQNCSAGQFSRESASTTCTSCSISSYSPFSGSSSCLTCITTDAVGSTVCDRGPCIMANKLPCPKCSSACSACKPGRYGGGATKCSSCPTGTFSVSPGLTSVSDCSDCPVSTATRQLDTGMTTCSSCAVVGRPLPKSSESTTKGQTCPWQCIKGAILVQVNTTTINVVSVNSTYATQGFVLTTNDSIISMYHRDNDYCCDGSVVDIGQWLSGCSPSSNGVATACKKVNNSFFIKPDGPSKLNRCDDWNCYFGYYRTGPVCTQQPVCSPRTTWSRDITGSLIASAIDGSFSCSPCSTCLAGTESFLACNATHDTVCRRCKNTWFSVAGSACIPTIPLGYTPVRVQYPSQPVFQGRPTLNSDNSSIASWPQSMFLYTYTTCASIDFKHRYTPNKGNNMCSKSDPASTTECLPDTIACDSECTPWNGTIGWYGTDPSFCMECTFDPNACFQNEYLNMNTCGPTTSPLCTSCPTTPLPNANQFFNPRATSTDGPYVCNFTCVNQYVKSGDKSACISCPTIPYGSAFDMIGCSWHCQYGFFLNSTLTGCNQCGPPPNCSIGFYADYNYSDTGGCMICLPCIMPVFNAHFISIGQPQSPDTCQYKCNPNFWYTDNPLGCYACSPDVTCVSGYTYYYPCTNVSDATCLECTTCPIGKGTTYPCNATNDISCVTCDPKFLPPNASFGLECNWTCHTGFAKETPTTCRKCLTSAECKISEQLFIPPNNCGRCDPCPTLLPGTQYIGDGQCGTMYTPGCGSRFYPLGSTKSPTAVGPVCAWTCNSGFTLLTATEGSKLSAYVAKYQLTGMPIENYTTMKALFHRDNDACCNASRVNSGYRLVNCSQTSGGATQNCTPVSNSVFFFDNSTNASTKLDRCSDYTCIPGFFSAENTCKLQPICGLHQTYNRDTTGKLTFNADGALSCVPCSNCLPGSQVLQMCTQAADTVCQVCNSSFPFAAVKGRCMSTIPIGYAPVSIYYPSTPAFQGRPSVLDDGVSPVTWPRTMFTYTPCAVKSPERRYTAQTAAMCNRTSAETTKCVNPVCPTECSPWNGKRGWYQSATDSATCLQCVFDPTTCLHNESVDMTTCGVSGPPQCISCAANNTFYLPPHATNWVTPMQLDSKTGPYQCDFTCADGFSKYNHTCIFCPPIPNNAEITQGCEWKCMQGFSQSNLECLPCLDLNCSIGFYIGFSNSSSQCQECQSCDAAILYPNTEFYSTTNCSSVCQPFHYSPGGFDPDTNSPLGACFPCTQLRVCSDGFYSSQCSPTTDSTCEPCSQCELGFNYTANCTQMSDTICSACDPFTLPSDAVWIDASCSWICPHGMIVDPTAPLVCIFPLPEAETTVEETTIEDTTVEDTTVEDTTPPLETTATSTSPPPTTTSSQHTTSTTQIPRTTLSPMLQYASVITVSLPIGMDSTFTQLVNTVATESQCVFRCTAAILSMIDPDGNTIMCYNNSCPGIPNNGMQILGGFANQRRLLITVGWVVNVALISPLPLPSNPNISVALNTSATLNTIVSTSQVNQMINNPVNLLNFVVAFTPVTSKPTLKIAAPTPQTTVASTSNASIVGAIVGAVVGVIMCCCAGGAVVVIRSGRMKRRQRAPEQRHNPRPTVLPRHQYQQQITPRGINVRIQPHHAPR